MLKITYNIILIKWKNIIFASVLTKKQQNMGNFNRFNCLLFVPLSDEKRVSIRLLRSAMPTRMTTIFQFKRFLNHVFKFKVASNHLTKSDLFVIHDNVAQCFYLCHFMLDAGLIVVESSISRHCLKLDIDDLLQRYLYYSSVDSHFLNWDELMNYLYERFYTGRFDADLFVRLNAPSIVLHTQDLSL